VLGRHAIADAGLYSVCLAIQNLWLAATAEGLGVGWVSFYREDFLRQLVGLPDALRPVAWLCVGPISDLPATPDLERHGWRQRTPLTSVVHHGRYRSVAND
jgi:5,6-dimethylbenzimidazole synthase